MLYGNDISDKTTALEADLKWICKFQKGDFLGKAVLEKQLAEGLTRKLVGFELRGPGIARPHYPVHYQGKKVSEVASGTFSPFLKKAIGLVYLPIEATAAGTEFEIGIRDRMVKAAVVPTPFYKRSKNKDIPSYEGGGFFMYPNDFRYTKDHEWVKVEGDEALIGITDFAQHQLGDIIFVELPPVGKALEVHQTIGTVESVKSVSDIYSPVAGEVAAVNEELNQTADILNKDPHGQGWIVRLKIKDKREIEGLMSAGDYEKFLEGLEAS
jgi:glycine cleavage system H protein